MDEGWMKPRSSSIRAYDAALSERFSFLVLYTFRFGSYCREISGVFLLFCEYWSVSS